MKPKYWVRSISDGNLSGPMNLRCEVSGTEIAGWVDGKEILRITDHA